MSFYCYCNEGVLSSIQLEDCKKKINKKNNNNKRLTAKKVLISTKDTSTHSLGEKSSKVVYFWNSCIHNTTFSIETMTLDVDVYLEAS